MNTGTHKPRIEKVLQGWLDDFGDFYRGMKAELGGVGSGYDAPHKGRPGAIGGSAPRGGVAKPDDVPDATASNESDEMPKRFFTNDIKKGMRVRLYDGYEAEVMDNAKGNTRVVKMPVMGMGGISGGMEDIGSTYAWNIVAVQVGEQWYPVVLTDKQKATKKKVKAFGFRANDEFYAELRREFGYPAPHAGRKGMIGGSLPRDGSATGGEDNKGDSGISAHNWSDFDGNVVVLMKKKMSYLRAMQDDYYNTSNGKFSDAELLERERRFEEIRVAIDRKAFGKN